MIKRVFACIAVIICVATPLALIGDLAFAKTPQELLCEKNPDSPACKSANLKDVIGTITNTLLFALGATCSVVIVISGIRFVTSGGDATAVTNAKNSILYGVIGLIIALSAFGVVKFVLSRFN